MRVSESRFPSHVMALAVLAVQVAAVAAYADVHRVAAQLCESFPVVAKGSPVIFEPADSFVQGRLTSGLRPRLPVVGPEVLYPHSFDGLIVARLGGQRVVLRPIGAFPSQAVAADGKLVYNDAYPSTDVMELPRGARSEKLLQLRDDRAPRTYDFEIVETEGVSAVVIDEGAVLFVSATAPAASEVTAGRFTHREPVLQIDRPWLVDATGRRYVANRPHSGHRMQTPAVSTGT